MSEYGLAVVVAIACVAALVVATFVLRSVVAAIVWLVWPGGRYGGPPNSAGRRPRRR